MPPAEEAETPRFQMAVHHLRNRRSRNHGRAGDHTLRAAWIYTFGTPVTKAGAESGGPRVFSLPSVYTKAYLVVTGLRPKADTTAIGPAGTTEAFISQIFG
jgi:hypothetical protein